MSPLATLPDQEDGNLEFLSRKTLLPCDELIVKNTPVAAALRSTPEIKAKAPRPLDPNCVNVVSAEPSNEPPRQSKIAFAKATLWFVPEKRKSEFIRSILFAIELATFLAPKDIGCAEPAVEFIRSKHRSYTCNTPPVATLICSVAATAPDAALKLSPYTYNQPLTTRLLVPVVVTEPVVATVVGGSAESSTQIILIGAAAVPADVSVIEVACDSACTWLT